MSNSLVRECEEFDKNSKRIISVLKKRINDGSIDKKSEKTMSSHLDFAKNEMACVDILAELKLENNRTKFPGVWRLRHLQQHVAGQILWHENHKANVDRVIESVMKDTNLVEFLELAPSKSADDSCEFRSLKKVLRAISPRAGKKGRPGRNETFQKFRPSPLIYDENEINDGALKMALLYSFIILRLRNLSLDETSNHPVLIGYVSLAGHLTLGQAVQQFLLCELDLE